VANPVLDKFVQSLLRGYIKSITFESNINDPVVINDPFAESPPGISDAAVAAIRPKITIQVYDQKPWIVAPAGEPSKEARANVKVGTVIGGIALGGLALMLLTRKR